MSKPYTGKNWSYGIIGAILFFMIFTMALAYIMVNQKVEVLYSDYYERALGYDAIQEQLTRGLTPKYAVNYSLNANKDSVFFSLPFKESAVGKVAFVKPNDANADKELSFKLGAGEHLAVDVSNFQKGFWQVELLWNSDSVSVMNRLKVVL
ncbi:hypothetical protein EP331_06350 [bacterium]|nr:MAG: hypothetical protein EP331_06350 [bacterium]